VDNYDVVVIGGGPGGLSSSLKAYQNNKKVLLIEREDKLGGILKQCIHNGFGLITFKEQLSGPEYVERYIDEIKKSNIKTLLSTFVLDIKKVKNGFLIIFSNSKGISKVLADNIIFATGCRERSAKQVFIQGDRCSGVLTAGLSQYYVNILGEKMGKEVVVLGSGDIGLIMARRLSLEGSHVKAAYEIKDSPSGLNRNIKQCLEDFNIPLYLSMTVTKTFGKDKLEAIEVAKVDKNMQVIEGTREIIPCDCLILSVGLIPENELISKLGVEMSKKTSGPVVDGQMMTSIPHIYASGNCLHVNDLVDYVSEASVIAGDNASKEIKEIEYKNITIDEHLAYCVPQRINIKTSNSKTIMYLRSRCKMDKAELKILDSSNSEIYKKNLMFVNPAETIRLEVNLDNIKDDIHITLNEKE